MTLSFFFLKKSFLLFVQWADEPDVPTRGGRRRLPFSLSYNGTPFDLAFSVQNADCLFGFPSFNYRHVRKKTDEETERVNE